VIQYYYIIIMFGDAFQKTLKSLWRKTARTIFGGVIVIGTIEVATHLPSQGRSSYFYHTLADEWIVPAMRRVLGPEAAHKMALNLAILAPTHRPSAREQQLNVVVRLWGNKIFSNPVGLAAGYDKDATAITPLMGMGFGFVEVGSVCLKAQPGSPSPRMFRLTEDEAIINRYGFNSMGADAVEESLKEYRRSLNPLESKKDTTEWWEQIYNFLWSTVGQQQIGLLGINLGKNKTSTTPLEDYQMLIHQLGPYADYLVINVSSPNTPGLRDLQNTTSLEGLLRGCQEACQELAEKQGGKQQPALAPPLLVKLSPDLTDSELEDIAAVLMKLDIDGIILTNTTTTRPTSLISLNKAEQGGLSGQPLKDRSTECIRILYRYTEGTIPIIGVGGISSGKDAYEKLRAGASLVQVYSGMIYKGPGMVSKIRDEVAELMLQNGQRDLQKDVIGIDHDDIFWKKQQQQQQQHYNTNER
jgi:dihydroorotate dehydrogenase